MTVMTESTDKRTQAAAPSREPDDPRRALRRFFLFGPSAEDAPPGAGLLPAHLAPFRIRSGKPVRVRTDYPVFLGPRSLSQGGAGASGPGPAGTGALCLGFDALLERARRALEGEGAGIGQILRDNLKRLEAGVLDLLEAEDGTTAGARETLRAAGAAMAEDLVRESGLSDADRQSLESDVERLAEALPPAPEGEARFVGPSRGVSLLLLRHALLDGRGTTRETFVREARELVTRGRALLDADRRKGPEAREKEAVEGSMGQMGKRFVDPSALVSVLGERRGAQPLDAARRERLERAVEVLDEVAHKVAAPRVRLLHDGTVPWIGEVVRTGAPAEGPGWIVVESSDPCAVAAEVFDREAERLAEALRARERIRLETSGEYEAARHEPWLERLAGLDWRAFDAGETGLIEPVVALESAGELADRGMVSLSRLLRSARPVQVLVTVDPAGNPGSERGSAGDAQSLGGFRFEPGYLGMSHREAFVQQSTETRPLHLMEGFLRAASSTRAGLHVVAPWPTAQERAAKQPEAVDSTGREGAPSPPPRGEERAGERRRDPTREGAPSPPPRGEERAGERRGDLVPPALVAGAEVDSRAHPLFRYDPETGPSWAHRLDFSGNPEPEADWPAGEVAGEAEPRPFTFGDFALLDPVLARHLRPIPTEAADDDDLLPLPAWLDLPSDEALHRVPTTIGVDASGATVRLAISRPLAEVCRDRLGFWRTLQELAGVKSEYARRAAEATREEVEEAARAERERLEAAHAAELARVRETASREAVDRLTAALLDVDLGLFAEAAPSVPSFAGKTPDEVAESLLSAIGGELDEDDLEATAGDGAGDGDAVSRATERLMGLIDLSDLDEESQETTD